MPDAEKVRLIRDTFGYGLGLLQSKKALEIANERFEGDLHLGALWVVASGFAISIRGDKDARDNWNESWARSRLESFPPCTD